MAKKLGIQKAIKKFTPTEWTLASCVVIFIFFSIVINRGITGLIISLFITLLVAQTVYRSINKMMKGEKESEKNK